MVYGGDGLSADGGAFYGGIVRSVKATHFEEEDWVVTYGKTSGKNKKTIMSKGSG